MNHLKTFENKNNQLKKEIFDIIDYEIETEDYYGHTVISQKSKNIAAEKIVDYLMKLGIDLYIDAEEFNL